MRAALLFLLVFSAVLMPSSADAVGFGREETASCTAPVAPGEIRDWKRLDEAVADAAESGRPILVYVDAPWCGPCRRMEHEVFPDVRALLDRVETARLGFDDHESVVTVGGVSKSEADWARHFGAEATPTLVLLDPSGRTIVRTTGFQTAESLSLMLAYVVTGAHRHVSFNQYVDTTNR